MGVLVVVIYNFTFMNNRDSKEMAICALWFLISVSSNPIPTKRRRISYCILISNTSMSADMSTKSVGHQTPHGFSIESILI
jgi:hypothetical protein